MQEELRVAEGDAEWSRDEAEDEGDMETYAEEVSNRMVYQYYRYERYVVLVLFVLLFTGVLDPVLSFLHGHLWNAVITLGSAPFRALGLL